MKTVLIGNGFNIQFSGRTYTSELILQRMKARARIGVYDSLFENTISGTEIIRVLDGLASEANRIIKGELDEFACEPEEKAAIDDFQERYTYIKKPEEIMMEDWLLVAYLHSKEFADDAQTQNGIKVAFHRMFLDAIYNEGEIQKLYKIMGKTTKRYLQDFDNIFTVNYDNNIEKLTGHEVYHLHGSFQELQPSENDEYVFGYLYKQKGECALIKGFEHCYCNALLEYSGDKKIHQADLFHKMNVQFEYAKETGIYPIIPDDNEEFVSLAFEHPELKVAPEYYFDDFRNIEDELVIIGLSPNNDNHILECIEKNEKLTQVCFYCYSEQEIKAVEKMKDNRIQAANVNDLWKKLGVKQKQYNNNYILPVKMDEFIEIVNIFSDSGISEERLKGCINELPRYEIDRLCSLVEQEIEKRGLQSHTPKDEEDLLRDFGFISCVATKNGILLPVLMLIYIAKGQF
jgi:NAD-dependent SIR2 family protein deacetylase